MLVVRAINAADLDALHALAGQVGSGMTTLKPDMKMLAERLDIACASFAQTIEPARRDYIFALEDTANGRLAGVCAIKGAVGLDAPFYNYRIGTLVHSSRELGVFTRMDTLYLSNDLTGSTELCSLFLHPDYRSGSNGKLLSKSRFLFIAQFPHLFTEKLIAEMRGYQTAEGVSPFYEGLGRHFFKMDFQHVDDLTSIGKKSFIAELMPRQPLYVAYLPQAAQDVIGQVHLSTAPARRLLEQEGLHFEGYIDIFDAGPVLQARVSSLRALRDSALAVVEAADTTDAPDTPDTPDPAVADPWLLSNTALQDFRVIVAPTGPAGAAIALAPAQRELLHSHAGATIVLAPAQRELLHSHVGDSVRALPLNPRRNPHV